MKIAICGSLNFTYEMKKIADELRALGFDIIIPITAEKIIQGEISLEDIKKLKENGKISKRGIKLDAIRRYAKVVKEADAILVTNFDKNNVNGYVGGNVFLEMGYAYILGKKIFLLNGIPELNYTDEIKIMQPIVLNGDLTKIK